MDYLFLPITSRAKLTISAQTAPHFVITSKIQATRGMYLKTDRILVYFIFLTSKLPGVLGSYSFVVLAPPH